MVFASIMGSCSLTEQLWMSKAVVPAPEKIVAGSVDSNGDLLVIIQKTNGGVQEHLVSRYDLETERPKHSASFSSMKDYATSFGAAPPYDLLLADERIWYKSDEFEGSSAVARDGVDWKSPRVYLAIVATPVTLVVDIVTAPVNIAWIVMTAGGHGQPWIPWFDAHHSRRSNLFD